MCLNAWVPCNAAQWFQPSQSMAGHLLLPLPLNFALTRLSCGMPLILKILNRIDLIVLLGQVWHRPLGLSHQNMPSTGSAFHQHDLFFTVHEFHPLVCLDFLHQSANQGILLRDWQLYLQRSATWQHDL